MPIQLCAPPYGGTAIFVHRRVSHHHFAHPNFVSEVTTVAASFGGPEIILSSIYNPPRSRITPAELVQLLPSAPPPASLAIKINTEKCESIYLTWKDYGPVLREVLTSQGDRLRWTRSTSYLGMVLIRRLSTNFAANRRIQIGRVAFMSLAPLLHRSSPLTTSTKQLLYISIIQPSITYAAPL
ncbi:hypothetical protein J6590_024760 [Homalodisca vitripennis]|nr:hypothetical protein J6590_024760 [Homalodisca vitripennis]